MKPARLPISLCHANCPKCRMPTEFRMFESGPGGDFATYLGVATGSIYRLDYAKVQYEGIPADRLLASIEQKEGKAMRVPEEIRCKICGHVFAARSVMIDSEEVIDAFEL